MDLRAAVGVEAGVSFGAGVGVGVMGGLRLWVGCDDGGVGLERAAPPPARGCAGPLARAASHGAPTCRRARHRSRARDQGGAAPPWPDHAPPPARRSPCVARAGRSRVPRAAQRTWDVYMCGCSLAALGCSLDAYGCSPWHVALQRERRGAPTFAVSMAAHPRSRTRASAADGAAASSSRAGVSKPSRRASRAWARSSERSAAIARTWATCHQDGVGVPLGLH